MRHQRDQAEPEPIEIGKDLPLTTDELTALRRSVDWPVRGDYAQILREGLFHVNARCDGQLVGFLQVVGSPHGDLLIHDLCVHPDFQGQGVAKRLVETALEVCRELKPQGVNVLFEESNRALFERFGFRIMYGGYMDGPSLKGEGGVGFPNL